MVLIIIWFLLFVVLIICDMSSHKTRQLFSLQKEMISEEKYLWISMLVLVIFFVIIKVKNVSLFEGDGLNTIFDNIVYSIIAAFVFYVLSIFYPKSKTSLMMNRNLYHNVSRINDIMDPVFKLFVNDVEDFKRFPEKFVDKFVVKKDKKNDKYTVDPFISGAIKEMVPNIVSMISSLRSRYSDYLHPAHLSRLDVVEDATLILTTNLIKKEMSYKEVYALYLQLTSIYITTHSLLDEYKKYE